MDIYDATAEKQEFRRRKFDSWPEAHEAGFRSKTDWRTRLRGIKGASIAYVDYKGREVPVYPWKQTTNLKPKTIAQNYLLDRFVIRQDAFGWQPPGSNDWPQVLDYRWGIKDIVKRGWNHARCHDYGIAFGDHLAQGFSIRAPASTEEAPSKTDFVVLDSDCHNPSPETIERHLAGLGAILAALPNLLKELGGGTWFYQYRRPLPTGIQIWICLSWKINTVWLHAEIRKFLHELGVKAEILPTESKQVSMPGCYPKSVFTDRELPLLKGWVDVVSLANHIRGYQPAGDILPRYRSLLEVQLEEHRTFRLAAERGRPQGPTQITSGPPVLRIHDPRAGNRYWTDLKQLAVEGITEPDVLYEFLIPLARALYFRDFAHKPDRADRTADELFQWVRAKHNGHVSRILGGRDREVEAQCRVVVRTLEDKTDQPVRDYYLSMLAKDLQYPHRVELIAGFMRQGATEAKRNAISLTCCKCAISEIPEPQDRPVDDTPLPSLITQQIEKAGDNLRKGKVRDRFTTFSIRLVNEIALGEHGEKNIHWKHLNAMLGKPKSKSRHTADRYKKLLHMAGVIRGDWEKFIRRGQCSSRYRLEPWAWDAVCSERAVAKTA